MSKRKTSSWKYIQFKGDSAIYALCNNCLFWYPSYLNKDREHPWIMKPKTAYPYCPICGFRMKNNNFSVEKLDYSWWEE